MNFHGHEKTVATTNDWITPRWITDSLGRFDLDPCVSVNQPWPTAEFGYTVVEDGLLQPWFGRVWLNPPYGKDIWRWCKKMAEHNYGLMLIFARTDTKWFHNFVAPYTSGILLLNGRVRFHSTRGGLFTRLGGGSSGGAPSMICSYGTHDLDVLATCGLPGLLLKPVVETPHNLLRGDA